MKAFYLPSHITQLPFSIKNEQAKLMKFFWIKIALTHYVKLWLSTEQLAIPYVKVQSGSGGGGGGGEQHIRRERRIFIKLMSLLRHH